MKKILLFGLTSLFTLTSCHYDDEEQDIVDNSYITGNYDLVLWKMPISSDIDGNGKSSHNLIEESDCFTHSAISVNEDFTFTLIHHEVLLKNGNFSCDTETVAGTWSRTGFVLTAITDVGQHEYTFTAGEQPKLTRKIEEANYPMIEDGNAFYANGDIYMVYERN